MVSLPVFPPAVILATGALVTSMVPSRSARRAIACAVPLVTLTYIGLALPLETRTAVPFLALELSVLRVDRLSQVFGSIFSLIAFIGGVYAWHNPDRKQQVASLLYTAGAVGATFAGDYVALYIFWELMAVSSVFLIWARNEPVSQRAGNRYLLVHLTGGAILLAGIIMHTAATGSLAFEAIAPVGVGWGPWLILLGFCLNAAIPPLGAWLPDAYPKATITGVVFCSALTTKTAVYALLRAFPGWEILVLAGVAMALYGLIYAVLSNDIRELLSYHIISQVGYMVTGVGLGTPLAINGATAHAVCHILYKALLFMGAGVVIHTTKRSNLTELGGFLSRQRLTFSLYLIGAFSISGFPLWSGFVSKSMVVSSTWDAQLDWAYLLLTLASVGTFLHTGLKLPYFTWMGPDRGIQPAPAPVNMHIGMAIAATLCTVIGVAPTVLYQFLPNAVDYQPYTAAHIIESVQLLLFTFFAFYLLTPSLGGERTVLMDTDVVYRKSASWVRRIFLDGTAVFFEKASQVAALITETTSQAAQNPTRWLQTGKRTTGPFEPDRERKPLQELLATTLFVFACIAILSLYIWSN